MIHWRHWHIGHIGRWVEAVQFVQGSLVTRVIRILVQLCNFRRRVLGCVDLFLLLKL